MKEEPIQVKVTLENDWGGKWRVMPDDYEADWTGDSWQGSPMGWGRTIQEALDGYEESYELRYDKSPNYKWS